MCLGDNVDLHIIGKFHDFLLTWFLTNWINTRQVLNNKVNTITLKSLIRNLKAL